MKTARDNAVWKVRVLLNAYGVWRTKTFFYARAFHVTRWRERAQQRPDRIQIDFIGKYTLEEASGPQDDHHHDDRQSQGQ